MAKRKFKCYGCKEYEEELIKIRYGDSIVEVCDKCLKIIDNETGEK